MENKDDKFDRYTDLSDKFTEMGQALINEGKIKNDYTLSQVGGLFILMSGIVLSEQDINEFSFLAALYSTKKMLDHTDETELTRDAYTKFVNRINRLRDLPN